jgi:hypothetical protein
MNDKLRDMIAQASIRVEAANTERQVERTRQHEQEQERDATTFKRNVETSLGKDVLDAIGPVTFNENFLSQSMTFAQDSRTFRLQQQTGALVQLEENNQMLVHQFNLNHPDSKDTFLHILGTALKSHKG